MSLHALAQEGSSGTLMHYKKTLGGSEQHPLRGAKDSGACVDARRRRGLAGARATITQSGGMPGWRRKAKNKDRCAHKSAVGCSSNFKIIIIHPPPSRKAVPMVC